MQLKCSSKIELRPDDFSFRLKLKNYDDLRRKTMVPRILAVLHVPEDTREWLVPGPDHVVLRHRAYWKNLLGEVEIKPAKPEDRQEKNITLQLQRANLLTPASLVTMMDNTEVADAI